MKVLTLVVIVVVVVASAVPAPGPPSGAYDAFFEPDPSRAANLLQHLFRHYGERSYYRNHSDPLTQWQLRARIDAVTLHHLSQEHDLSKHCAAARAESLAALWIAHAYLHADASAEERRQQRHARRSSDASITTLDILALGLRGNWVGEMKCARRTHAEEILDGRLLCDGADVVLAWRWNGGDEAHCLLGRGREHVMHCFVYAKSFDDLGDAAQPCVDTSQRCVHFALRKALV
jgi:hypothetical protein